jgi:2-polyprenyl-6-methoxyphenol hydroxylase-like FAD-dependent oxidoreductase
MKPLSIRIIGGSLGGLFAATLLRLDGHDVRIYERSASGLGGRGAGLVGQREIFTLLRAVGRERVAKVGVTAYERITLARSGEILETQSTPQTQISWDHLYNTFRLMQPHGTYRMGCAIRAVEQDGSSAIVVVDGQPPERVDLVLGADGVGSIVREAVMQRASPSVYAGYVAWRGLIGEGSLPSDAARVLLDRMAFFHLPHSHVLGYLVAGAGAEMAVGKRRYNWVWYRPVPAAQLSNTLTDRNGVAHRFSLAPGAISDVAAGQLVDAAREMLPSPFAQAIGAEPRPFVQAIFDYEAPAMVSGRLALLGDAAFVVRPHTAMGVSKAAGDALALRHYLQGNHLGEALAAYASERSAAGHDIAAYGRRLGASLETS